MSGNIPIDNPAIRTYWIAYENSMKQVVEGYGFVDPHQKLLSKWFIDETIDEDEWLAEVSYTWYKFLIHQNKINTIKLNQMKIKEEELKLIQEQQKQLNELVHNIGLLESQKHGLLHEIAGANKEIEDYKEVLEAEYGAINIDLEDGTYTEIKEDVEGDKED
jgi:hypothetical protein